MRSGIDFPIVASWYLVSYSRLRILEQFGSGLFGSGIGNLYFQTVSQFLLFVSSMMSLTIKVSVKVVLAYLSNINTWEREGGRKSSVSLRPARTA